MLEQSLSVRALQEMLANTGQNSEGVSAPLLLLLLVLILVLINTFSSDSQSAITSQAQNEDFFVISFFYPFIIHAARGTSVIIQHTHTHIHTHLTIHAM